jgi:hypothetical protein
MKLMKKRPSTSCVFVTADSSQSITGGAANHGDFLRLDSRSMAVTSNHKVGSITQVSFRNTSRERVWSPYQAFNAPMGLEKHSQLKERQPSCNVEEGAHNRSNWNTAHLIRKCLGVMAMVATGLCR